MSNKYRVWVFHGSYFCGKMLAYLQYKGIPHEAIYGTLGEYGKEIYNNTGLRQMPVVKTPEGQWLQDTTPMINWFEAQFPDHSVLPQDPVTAFLTRLLEDYADEWLWRPAIYYRWMKETDRSLYKTLFVKEFVGGFWAMGGPVSWLAGKLVHKHQRDKFLHGDGMTPNNQAHIESIYINTLARLEAIFQQQPFLLGDKPCLADFGFFASMFWHFSSDPSCRRIMQEQAPAVFEWVARMWNAKAEKLEERQFSHGDNAVPELWHPIIRDIAQQYLPYLRDNALAFNNQAKHFDMEIEGYHYPKVNVSPYRVYCREMLQQHYRALPEAAQQQVQDVLGQVGSEALLSHSDITASWDPDNIAPLCRPGKVTAWQHFKSQFTGTNHIQTLRAWRRKNGQ